MEAAPALDAADAAVKLMIANMLADRIPRDSGRFAKEDAATALALATQAANVVPPSVESASTDIAAACHLFTHIVRADLTPPWKNKQAAGGAALLLADAVLALECDAGVPVRELGGWYYLTPHFAPAAVRRRKRAAIAT